MTDDINGSWNPVTARRAEIEALVVPYVAENIVRQDFLVTRAAAR